MNCVIRKFFTCLCLCIPCLSIAWAGADVCENPATYSRLSIALDAQEDSTIDEVPGEIGLENREIDIQFKASNDKLIFGVSHRYSIFDIDVLQPATNGHLHTFFLPLHVLKDSEHKSFRISIAPAVSASSNVIKSPDEYTSDAIQMLAALIWGRRLSDRTSLKFGLCGDHRFGDYQVYPVVGIKWQPHPDWNVELGFPTSQLSYRISAPLSSTIRIAPDGNEWFVLDRSLTIRSQFVYETYAIEWTFDWNFHESFVVSGVVGRQFHNRFEMTLLDQSRVRLSGDPVNRVGAAFEWRF